MPELPEVEVVCQGLQPHIINRSIQDVWYSNKPLRFPFILQEAQELLLSATIISISRRAKYVLLQTNNDSFIVVHLGMTGRLGVFPAGTDKAKHDHVIFSLDNSMEFRFNDTRRFGSIRVLKCSSLPQLEDLLFKDIGVEPLEEHCTPIYLQEKAKRKTQAIKNFIMDNRIIVGVGNIYANESLFTAKIDPNRAANSLTKAEWKRLHTTIISTLRWAIECGGSTISDFINASGESGYFQANFKVYGKDGTECSICEERIQKTKIGGRATFFCGKCQK